MMKTSTSHPLRIDPVSLGEGCGEIGLTFCPGKYMRHGFTGSWDRDLDAEAIRLRGTGGQEEADCAECGPQ